MLSFINKTMKGCGYLPGYGWHPGNHFMAYMAAIGVVIGVTSHSPNKMYKALEGALFITVPLLPAYLYGAYERVTDYERRPNDGNN